jgi:5'-nucleotidase
MVKLQILHFNDVYHVDEASTAEPVGGCARFYTKIKQLQSHAPEETLILFSGDAFNPSIDSSVTKGAHMVPVLNKIGVNVACVGNHDLDFGLPVFGKLVKQTSFPWLMSNVWEAGSTPEEKTMLGKVGEYHILEKAGLRIGVIGLVEQDWLDALPSVPSDIIYVDFMKRGEELATLLKGSSCPGGPCDLVIALTHSRLPNDLKLCELDCIDLILGGHDHDYNLLHPSYSKFPRGVKSGTDFRQLSQILLTKNDKEPLVVEVHRHDIVSSIPRDEEMHQLVLDLTSSIKASMGRRICVTATPWDARSTHARTQETGLGNLTCDLMKNYYKTDISMITGGTLRSDNLYKGNITIRDLLEIFPFDDPTVVLRYPGSTIRAALENGVSKYPSMDGRFCHFSGMKMKFNPSLPSNHRIISVIMDDGKPLDDGKVYSAAIRGFMADGWDGYEVLKKGDWVIDHEDGMMLSAMFRKYFTGLRVVNRIKELTASKSKTGRDSPQFPIIFGKAVSQFLKLVGRDIQTYTIKQILNFQDGLDKTGEHIMNEFDAVEVDDEIPVFGGIRYPKLTLNGRSQNEVPIIAPGIEGRILAVDDAGVVLPPPFEV